MPNTSRCWRRERGHQPQARGRQRWGGLDAAPAMGTSSRSSHLGRPCSWEPSQRSSEEGLACRCGCKGLVCRGAGAICPGPLPSNCSGRVRRPSREGCQGAGCQAPAQRQLQTGRGSVCCCATDTSPISVCSTLPNRNLHKHPGAGAGQETMSPSRGTWSQAAPRCRAPAAVDEQRRAGAALCYAGETCRDARPVCSGQLWIRLLTS